MVRTFKPKSSFLRRYVKLFSVFEKGCDLNINFATLPSVEPPLALLKNAAVQFDDRHLMITPDDGVACNSLVLGKYTSPVVITYNGYVDEVSVNFTPLGINYFFDRDYRSLAPANFQTLAAPQWLDFAPRLFSSDDVKEQLDRFETFLISRFREKPLDRLQRAVDLFMDREQDAGVGEVAHRVGMNEKTMRRQFHRFAGCSPVTFKRIVRFRQAVAAGRSCQGAATLTALGHEARFYDSSHFAREYRLLSGLNPACFFKTVSYIGNSDYPYIFL